jgi:hypothetical protein
MLDMYEVASCRVEGRGRLGFHFSTNKLLYYRIISLMRDSSEFSY